MSSQTPPKSTLKNAAPPPPTTTSNHNLHPDLSLAQTRAATSLEILTNIEILLDLPTPPPTTPTTTPTHPFRPTPSDIHTFKTALHPFQPSDYDDLVLERNVLHKCGYALCPAPRPRSNAQFRLTGMGTGKVKDFKILPRAVAERWCGEECARKGLWVRVQLSEVPAWERVGRGVVGGEVELWEEKVEREEREQAQAQLAEDMSSLALDPAEQQAQTQQGKDDLARERGDAEHNISSGRVEFGLVENEVVGPAVAPSLDAQMEGDDIDGKLARLHLSLEGYTPRYEGRVPEQSREDTVMK